MAQITEEMARQFARLRRQGLSFREIGRRFRVDARTAKSWVEKIEGGLEKEHWESVVRQVDARYLEKHHRLLLHTAQGIMRAVEVDPFTLLKDSQSFVASQIQLELERAAELLEARGIGLFFRSAPLDWHEREHPRRARIALKTLNGLLEHEPELEVALRRWERMRARFHHHLDSMAGRAKNLLGFEGLDDELAQTFGHKIAKAVLAGKTGREPAGRLSLDQRCEGRVAVMMETGLGIEEVCTGPSTEIGRVVKAGELVLTQVDNEELVRAGVQAYERVIESLGDLQERLDQLQLKGRPRGNCSLCPGGSNLDSAGRSLV